MHHSLADVVWQQGGHETLVACMYERKGKGPPQLKVLTPQVVSHLSTESVN